MKSAFFLTLFPQTPTLPQHITLIQSSLWNYSEKLMTGNTMHTIFLHNLYLLYGRSPSNKVLLSILKGPAKGRHKNSHPLTPNFSQKLTQPSKGISYTVGDICRHFTKRTLLSAYILLHSNPIPPTDGVTCNIQITNRLPMFHQGDFCHHTVGNFDVSPNQTYVCPILSC